jgi:hypothetical protein
MLITHKLKKGETFATVMKKHGVTDWKTSWDLPENKGLKARRRTADKVEPGDTLTFVDPKARLHRIVLSGKTYHVPEADFEAMCEDVKALIRKKVLPELSRLKAIYDDDYLRLMNITSGGEGTIYGIIACAAENLSGAVPPTWEMNNVAADINKLKGLIKSGADFAEQLAALRRLQTSLDDYVKASNDYHDKMVTGHKRVIVAADLTATGLFILLNSMTSGAASLAVKGFSSLEIGAAIGAANAFLKAAATELGEALVGNERSAGEVTYNLVSEFFFGAASSALSSVIRDTPIGRRIKQRLAEKIRDGMADYVDRLMVRSGLAKWNLDRRIYDVLSEKDISELVATHLMRSGISVTLKAAIAVFEAKEHAEALFDAAKTALSEATGKEKPEAIGDSIADAFATETVLDAVGDRLLADIKPGVVKALEAAAEAKSSGKTHRAA